MPVCVKAQKSLQREKKPYETRWKILYNFKAPSFNTNGYHLKAIYERTPVQANGIYRAQLSWHGGVHNPYVYYEPVTEMLKVKIWPMFYYCNDIHETISAFSIWWSLLLRSVYY